MSKPEPLAAELEALNRNAQTAIDVIAGADKHIAALRADRARLKAQVADLEKNSEVRVKAFWTYGYSCGHHDGFGCGHDLAPPCKHDAEEEFECYKNDVKVPKVPG